VESLIGRNVRIQEREWLCPKATDSSSAITPISHCDFDEAAHNRWSGFIGSNFIRLMLRQHDDIQVLNIDDLRLGSNPENLGISTKIRDINFAREI